MRYLTLVALTLFSFSSQAQLKVEPLSDTALVYGIGHGYTITAAEGWQMDVRAGRLMGLPATLYPKGGSFQTSAVVMYSNVTTLMPSGPATMEDAIRNDIEEFESSSPGVKVKKTGTIKLDGRKAVIYEFINPESKNYESVAYIGEENVVVFIVYASRDEEQYRQHLEAFKETVRSYTWRPESIKTKDNEE